MGGGGAEEQDCQVSGGTEDTRRRHSGGDSMLCRHGSQGSGCKHRDKPWFSWRPAAGVARAEPTEEKHSATENTASEQYKTRNACGDRELQGELKDTKKMCEEHVRMSLVIPSIQPSNHVSLSVLMELVPHGTVENLMVQYRTSWCGEERHKLTQRHISLISLKHNGNLCGKRR